MISRSIIKVARHRGERLLRPDGRLPGTWRARSALLDEAVTFSDVDRKFIQLLHHFAALNLKQRSAGSGRVTATQGGKDTKFAHFNGSNANVCIREASAETLVLAQSARIITRPSAQKCPDAPQRLVEPGTPASAAFEFEEVFGDCPTLRSSPA